LIATLPHFTGGPRRANGKLYAQPAPLTLPPLQTRVREFIDAYNHEHHPRQPRWDDAGGEVGDLRGAA
jgi:hypothetical protein